MHIEICKLDMGVKMLLRQSRRPEVLDFVCLLDMAVIVKTLLLQPEVGHQIC